MNPRLLPVTLAVALLAQPAMAQVQKAQKKTAPPHSRSSAVSTPSDDEDDDEDESDDDGKQPATHDDSQAPAGDVEAADSTDSTDSTDSDDKSDDSDDDSDDDVADPTTISANVAMTTDYMLRGLTQTSGQPAIQGGFEWNHPWGFDLSTWASNVRFPDLPTSIELDFGGGFSYEVESGLAEGLVARLGGLYYWYVDDASRNSWDVQATAEWRGFKAEVDFSPQWEGTSQHAWYFNFGWSDEVIWGITPGAFVGYSLYQTGSFYPSYADYKISLSREFLGLTWEAAGVFTAVQRLTEIETIVDPDDEDLTVKRSTQIVQGGSRAVFTVSKSF